MDGKNIDITSEAPDVEKVRSAVHAEYSGLQQNESHVDVDPQELNRLAETIRSSKMEFRVMTERMSDPISYLMKTSSQDKCVIANALMETTIRYISDNFKGAYLDWDSSDDPYIDIKIGILKGMGYVEKSRESDISKKKVSRVAVVRPPEEYRYRPPYR